MGKALNTWATIPHDNGKSTRCCHLAWLSRLSPTLLPPFLLISLFFPGIPTVKQMLMPLPLPQPRHVRASVHLLLLVLEITACAPLLCIVKCYMFSRLSWGTPPGLPAPWRPKGEATDPSSQISEHSSVPYFMVNSDSLN